MRVVDLAANDVDASAQRRRQVAPRRRGEVGKRDRRRRWRATQGLHAPEDDVIVRAPVIDDFDSLDGTPARWLEGILHAASPALDCDLGVVAFTARFEDMLQGRFETLASTAPDPLPLLQATNTSATSEIVDLLTRRAWVFGAMSELLELLTGTERASYHRAASQFAMVDALGLFAHDGEGGVLDVAAPAGRPLRTNASQRALWARLAVHLTAMARLRRRLRAEEAVLTPDGRVAHAADDAHTPTSRDLLVRAVRARERARGRLRRDEPDPRSRSGKA
jgi:hypothetical protein